MAYKRTKTGTILITRKTASGNEKVLVRVTARRRKELKYLVSKANLKRKEVLSKYSKKRLEEREIIKNKNRGGDFITAKKSQKLSRFKTQEQFNQYLRRLREISRGTYEKKMYSTYRKNLISSIKKKFGSKGEDLITKLKDLSDEEIRDATLADKLHDVGWIYNEPIKDNTRFKIITQQIDNIVASRGK